MLFPILLSLFIVCIIEVNGNLENTLNGRADIVDFIAGKATDLVNDRCNVTTVCNCSQHACSPILDGLECSFELGGTDVCINAGNCQSQMLNYNEGFITTAFGDTYTNIVQQDICLYENLDYNFARLLEIGTDSGATTNKWTYMGTVNGVMRMWPGKASQRSDGDTLEEACSSYDPRIRPWFAAASSGPKDVVMLLDFSGSMTTEDGFNGESRIDLLKNATNGLLNTFTSNDYISLIPFSNTDETYRLCNNRYFCVFNSATEEMIENYVNEINSTPAAGGTNFLSAFEKAFNTLKDSNVSDNTSNCTPIIIFLTDGFNNDTLQDDPNKYLLEQIDAYQDEYEALTGKRAIIFTISMSNAADTNLPRQIACRNNGTWDHVLSGRNPISQMTRYINYLAESIRNTTDVRWSNPYMDYYGLGRMVTVSKAVFDIDGQLAGVVGTDVTFDEIREQSGINDDLTIINQLIHRSSICKDMTIDNCKKQQLRGTEWQCPSLVDFSNKNKCLKATGFNGSTTKYYRVTDTKHAFSDNHCSTVFSPNWTIANPLTIADLYLVGSLSKEDGSWVSGGIMSSDTYLMPNEYEPRTQSNGWVVYPVGAIKNVKIEDGNTQHYVICQSDVPDGCDIILEQEQDKDGDLYGININNPHIQSFCSNTEKSPLCENRVSEVLCYDNQIVPRLEDVNSEDLICCEGCLKEKKAISTETIIIICCTIGGGLIVIFVIAKLCMKMCNKQDITPVQKTRVQYV